MNSERKVMDGKRVNGKKREFQEGFQDGIPIGIGYFVVAFSLGIAAKDAGMTVFQGFLTSLLCNASAGQYAFFTQVANNASFLEIAVMTLVTNVRYLLMGCALSQKLPAGLWPVHRFLIGVDVTDELFGIEIARPGALSPWYAYGAMCGSVPFWAAGTAVGMIVGNLFPAQIVSGLGVALYGMFLAVIIPQSRTNLVVGLCVLVSFAASYLAGIAPFLAGLSVGNRTILLTVIISTAAAVLFPIKEEGHE